jgi:hypothetical protein
MLNESQFGKNMWTITKWILASVFGVLGIVLLVAGKSTAGAAFVCSALIIVLPLSRLVKKRRLSIWLRVAVIAVLCMIAIRSISSTDIVPGQGTTGYVFVDQVLAIFQRFQDNILGKEISANGQNPLRRPMSPGNQ